MKRDTVDDPDETSEATALQVDAHPSHAPAMELARGAVLGGRYVIQTVLGRGGTGLVLRAFDRVIDADVAIKVLRPEYAADRQWVDRLAREVKLARAIHDPNVCRIFDFGQADGHAFVTMELATGGTLRDVIGPAARARSSEARVADALAVIRGLAAIHAAGIVHRDVTPQNVLRMGDGRLVVSDFGLATAMTGTTTSIRGGTIGYMAPEVLRGGRAEFTSDVWSLGLVLHELLFGTRPEWRGEEPPRAGEATGVHSKEERTLQAICGWCLGVQPAQRPASATAVLGALEVGGRLPPSRSPGKRWVIAALAAGVALALGAGTRLARSKHTSATTPQLTAADASEIPLLTPIPDLGPWLASSRVIATYDTRLECMMPLPDHKTIRVVIDEPRSAEDIDIATGARRPANLLPVTIQEGCARLSPDGRKLAYQGRDEQGYSRVFVSDYPDGTGARAVVSNAEPSIASEPHWIDNNTFVFEPDKGHAAIFALDRGDMTILPTVGRPHLESDGLLKATTDHEILIAHIDASMDTTDVGIYEWPTLQANRHFRLNGIAADWAISSRYLFAAVAPPQQRFAFFRADMAGREPHISEPSFDVAIRYCSPVDDGRSAFVRYTPRYLAWLRDRNGIPHVIPTNTDPEAALRSVAGDILVLGWKGKDLFFTRYGKDFLLREGPRLVVRPAWETIVALFPDGKHWAFARPEDGIYQCEFQTGDCDRLRSSREAPPAHVPFAISPDGQLIAYVTTLALRTHVGVINLNGGSFRDLGSTAREVTCPPAWDVNHRLWISRMVSGAPRWIEVNVDNGLATGRQKPGKSRCRNPPFDLDSPVERDVWVTGAYRSEVRVVDNP